MKKKIIAALLLLGPICVHATPVTWTLEDVLVSPFNNTPLGGSALTGSFTYDADLNLYSNVDITSQSGPGLSCVAGPPVVCNGNFINFAGQHYDYAANASAASTAGSFVGLNSSLFFDGLIGDPLLYLKFAEDLSNAGGTVQFALGGVEYLCADASCRFNYDAFRSVAYTDGRDASGAVYWPYSGRVVAVSVPEPSAFALLSMAGFLMVFRRRNRV